MHNSNLPIRYNLTLVYFAVLVIAILLAVASVAGILYRTTLYPESAVVGNVGTDAFSLVVGLPFLLGTLWFARRGSLFGLLFLPGALLYVLYVYVAYLIGVPFNALFLVYTSLIVLSAYTIIGLVVSIDSESVRERFGDGIPARSIGGILALLALLFGAYQVTAIVDSLINGTAIDPSTVAVGTSDLIVQCPVLLISGILLWQHKPVGYVMSAGLLLQIGVLFISLPISFALSALLLGATFDTGLIAVGITGMIPLALIGFYLRSAAKHPIAHGMRESATM